MFFDTNNSSTSTKRNSEGPRRREGWSAPVTAAERELVIRYSCLIAAREPFKSVTRGEERRTRDSPLASRRHGLTHATSLVALLTNK